MNESFPVSIRDVPEPDLPGEDWARILVRYSGICGSDLHAINPDASGSSTLRPFVPANPQLGHEIGGVVIEAGPACPIDVGTRVAVDQVLGCIARGFPPCARCSEGAVSACLRFGEGAIPGYGLGLTVSLGAGWSEQLVAHASQIYRVPDVIEEEVIPLIEPLSVAVHGVLRRPPAAGSTVLVVGSGMIGLACIAALRALVTDATVVALARHEHQAREALALGAHAVVRQDEEATAFGELAEIVGVRTSGRGRGTMLLDGYTTVVDAVGSSDSFSLAARLAAKRGAVLLIGAAARGEVDLAPVWFKELDILGSFCHGVDPFKGHAMHSFARAIEILSSGTTLQRVVTHVFPLEELQIAIDTAGMRSAGAIKVLLEVNPP